MTVICDKICKRFRVIFSTGFLIFVPQFVQSPVTSNISLFFPEYRWLVIQPLISVLLGDNNCLISPQSAI